MKTWPLFFIAILLLACNSRQQQNKSAFKPDTTNYNLPQDKSVSKADLIGNWGLTDMYAGIDTSNAPNFKDIYFETDISFYNNGSFKKHDAYNTDDDNKRKKLAGYMSKYKVSGDTVFIYEPVIKHWYALYVTLNSKGEMEIGSKKGYSHLDTHYFFHKLKN